MGPNDFVSMIWNDENTVIFVNESKDTHQKVASILRNFLERQQYITYTSLFCSSARVLRSSIYTNITIMLPGMNFIVKFSMWLYCIFKTVFLYEPNFSLLQIWLFSKVEVSSKWQLLKTLEQSKRTHWFLPNVTKRGVFWLST